jgi:3-phenylpropionate/trans-cinnamate dioxygenase ferredoxin subunit
MIFHRTHRWAPLPDERLATLPEGSIVRVVVGRRALAVARVDGVLRGMEDRCPHQAALLSKGFVKDGHVVCAVHRFHYHAATGACRMAMTGPVAVFPLREAGGRVEVGLPATALRLFGRDLIIRGGK